MRKPATRKAKPRNPNVDIVDRVGGLAAGLRRAMAETGWSERGLALRAGLTTDRLRNVGRGRTTVLQGDAIARVAEVLGTTPGMLTGAEAWPTGGLKPRPLRPSRKALGHDGSPAELARAAWKAAEAAAAAAHAAQAAADAARVAADAALSRLSPGETGAPMLWLHDEALRLPASYNPPDKKRTRKQVFADRLIRQDYASVLRDAYAIVWLAKRDLAAAAGHPWPERSTLGSRGRQGLVVDVDLPSGVSRRIWLGIRWQRSPLMFVPEPIWDASVNAYVWPPDWPGKLPTKGYVTDDEEGRLLFPPDDVAAVERPPPTEAPPKGSPGKKG